MKTLVVTILFLCMVGCSEKDSNFSGKLSKEKMQEVMWEIIGADIFTYRFIKKDSLKNTSVENVKLQNKIFALHKVTRADFYKSYEYYVTHPDQMKAILDSMTVRAERERTKMTQQQYGGQSKKTPLLNKK